ncbi:TPA: hypothetical protein QDZ66_002609 [Pluralibacter gergoviae]|uniref:Uncharacterized protein n=1 Tax=Pluralibacter gergoviae TaxID=61647 RepID=A0A089R6G2_PLUGE|nr:hypothetical protein [Pluralibacter gergoviae]AIR02190.1 hypothetical protein LG71_20790 [Pluralibacter gergoviae]EKT9640162.1 hypothetical protein [Pluralibacter gergoviae]EKV3543285.1 hypothetical protein [Pluralibacter gergoviae]EKV9898414.1 hypothetical protein [Pluralibacter gergoviae]EKW9973799.1 hypothetical protein [Pluralibacter gergoviae]
MFKSLFSLLITEILTPISIIGIAIFFIFFFPDYWIPLVIISIIILGEYISKILEKLDKLD